MFPLPEQLQKWTPLPDEKSEYGIKFNKTVSFILSGQYPFRWLVFGDISFGNGVGIIPLGTVHLVT